MLKSIKYGDAVTKAIARTTSLLPRCKGGSSNAVGTSHRLIVVMPLGDSITAVEWVQVVQTLQKAQELGMTVMRMWAFADGPDEWNGLQPALGMLDEAILR